jgi:hypothetical protein
LKKIAQNVAQSIFLAKMNGLNCGKEWPKNVGYFCNFPKTAQSKQSLYVPKFAHSGHTGRHQICTHDTSSRRKQCDRTVL